MISSKYIEYLRNRYSKDTKILVAMSGGVDSSVTATLLHAAGFEIIGVTLQLYRSNDIAKGKTCCAGRDIKDAQIIAQQKGFKHYILDYTEYFKAKVIDDFVDSYENGETPIPCGRCNQYIKFGYLLDFCKKINFDLLVTGHYVKKEDNKLYKGQDLSKDQSYFLALTTKEQLKQIDFPLANIEKTTVRKIAEEFNLKIANKQESMDICFIPDGNYKNFLKKIRPEMFKEGEIFDRNDNFLGMHSGLANYTIGQRKGLNLANGPWYVNQLIVEKNQLIVGKMEDFKSKKCKIKELSLLINKEYLSDNIEIKIRSTSKIYHGKVDIKKNEVTFFEENLTLCKGQICAFYDQNQLLGGGIIDDII